MKRIALWMATLWLAGFMAAAAEASVRFDACDGGITNCTAAPRRLYTRVAKQSTPAIQIVALKSDGSIDTGFHNKPVKVKILGYYNASPPINPTTGCPNVAADWQTREVPIPLMNGMKDYLLPLLDAARRAHIHIACPASSCGTAMEFCSSDAFAVRPGFFTVDSISANADPTSGSNPNSTPKLAAGSPGTGGAPSVSN